VAWGIEGPFLSLLSCPEIKKKKKRKGHTAHPQSSLLLWGPPRNKIIFKHPNVVVSPFVSFSSPPFISLRYSLASLLVRKFSVIEPICGRRSPSWQSGSPG
jgi:hypothetical protein